MNLKAIWAGLPRPARICVAAAAGAAVAGVAVVTTVAATGAASPSPSPSPSASSSSTTQAYCDRFVGHIASNLGKSQDQVNKAISDALTQTLNDAVKNGDLTQKQADAIKARLGNGRVCAAGVEKGIGAIGGIGRIGKLPDLNPGARMNIAGISLSDIASALGISQQELRQDLESGKTLKDIAASRGMDEAAFRAKLATAVKADLDKRVAAGELTQSQEDMILQRIQNGTLPLWDKSLPRPFKPAPPATPSAGAST
jgi:uncharacterized protein YidB (DUF937 family)